MRLFRLPAFLGLTLALHGCVLSGSRRVMDRPDEANSPGEAILQALVVLGGGDSRISAPAALDDLEQHEATAGPKDREMIQALIRVLEKVADTGETLGAADYRATLDVMTRMAESKPKDFDVQYTTATGMTAMEAALRAAGAESAEAGESRAKDLVARFPNEARAHAHLGNVIAKTDAPLAMRSYARCMRLDPGIVTCKTGLRTVAARFEEPRCTSVLPGKLSLHQAFDPNAATAKGGRKGLKSIKVAGRLLLMEEKPVLDGGAIDEATTSGIGKDQTVTLTLSPRGTGTLADVTSRLAERQGYLAILVGGKVHAAPQVMSSIETGLVTIAGVSLAEICAKLEKRPLPKEVQGLL